MRPSALVLVGCLALPVLAEGPARKKTRRGKARPAAEASAPPARTLPEAPAQGARADLPDGLALRPVPAGLAVESVPSEGPLAGLGLRLDDVLTHLGGERAASASAAAGILASWPEEVRLFAVVLRAGVPVGLQAPERRVERLGARSAGALSPREEAARESHLESARSGKPLASLTAPALEIPAGERLWLRFPRGLPASPRPGQVVEAETAAPMAADKKLDFLAVPPGSKVWLSVLEASESGPARSVRLHAYKLALAGGRAYPLSAVPSAAAGAGSFVRVAAGGSLVTAPGPEARLALDSEWTIQVRLLEPLTLHEPESYYRAGPGLWFKEALEDGVRVLEITHVVAGRSAERAGLKPGDRVYSVSGDASARLGFAAALDKLYGPPGGEVALRVTRRGERRSETLRLQRGAGWRHGYGLRLRRDGAEISAQEAAPGSPAAKAGVKPGMRLVRVGGAAAEGLDRAALRRLLEGEGDTKVEFVFADGGRERSVELARDWYAAPLKLDLKPVPYGK